MEKKKLNCLMEIRKKKHLNRQELAELSGVPKDTIYALEKGCCNIHEVKIGTLVKLATALKVHAKRFYKDDVDFWKHI